MLSCAEWQCFRLSVPLSVPCICPADIHVDNSFQEIGDSILPLFVEMIRWSAARRKDTWMTQQPLEAQGGAEDLLVQQGPSNIGNSGASVGPSVVASGIYYSGGANGHGNANDRSGSPSLVSILKTESLENESPVTPLRSNRNVNELSTISEASSRLPDSLQEDIPEDTEFTIECIPNGTETSSFVDVSEGNDLSEPLDNSKGNGLKEAQDSSTASTSTSETDIGKDSQSTIPSPDLPLRQRERQVRFSDLVDNNMKMPSPRSQREGEPSKPIEPQYSGATNDEMGYVQHIESNSDHGAIEIQAPRKKEKYTHPLAVLKILKVLRYFSRVLSAMVPMAHFPGLLDELIFQMKIRKVGTDSTDGILRTKQSIDRDDDSYSFHSAKSNDDEIGIGSNANGPEKQNSFRKKRNSQYLDNASVARMDAIATIVNLACAEENKNKLLQHPGLLDAIIHVAQNDIIDDAREHASIVLMNLALAEDNKVSIWCYWDVLVTLVHVVVLFLGC